MALVDVSDEPEGPPSGEVDIPPAIACATCGRPSCDGCEPQSDMGPAPPSVLPWEEKGAERHQSLVETSELTATRPDLAFGKLTPGSTGRALSFALWCEGWAVGSFSLAWAAVFYALFPFVATNMASSPSVVLLATTILVALIIFVVLVHALWGVGLEWGIARAGRPASFNLGLRFGLYACGWDLLTSPAGFYFQARRLGLRGGLAAVRAGTKAPRPSIHAYLADCRRLSEDERRTAVWTAILLGVVSALICGAALFAALLAVWVPEIFS